MDARVPARIWFLLLILILKIIKPALSKSLNQDQEYEKNKLTRKFKPAIPTEALIFLESAKNINSTHVSDTAEVSDGRSRSYRQVESEATTTIEPITKSDDDIKKTDFSEKYDSLTTTDIVDSNNNKTVIPLPSTETYDFIDAPDLTDANKTEVTDQNNELSELMKSDTTFEVTDIPKGDKEYENVEPTTDLNQDEQSVTSSSQGLNPIENIKPAEGDEQLDVVGLSEAGKKSERIMVLQPSKEEKYVFLKENVHNMVEDTMLRKETEDYVTQLNKRYEDLPVVEADNSIWRKYSRAVVESFVLDFMRNYPHYTASEQWIARWYKEEEYNRIYNTTLHHLREKKDQTAVQFAAAVRRAADIYKAILDTPIGIVQSKCKAHMPQWLCFAEYVVHLADVAESCEEVWYHAQVHLNVLQTVRQAKGAKDPASQIIDELDARLSSLELNNDVSYLFDFITQTVGDLRKGIKDALLSRVSVYSYIRDLQNEDKLRCLTIDQQL